MSHFHISHPFHMSDYCLLIFIFSPFSCACSHALFRQRTVARHLPNGSESGNFYRFANPAEANFEHPFSLRRSLESARNFSKTRFGRFAIFDCSTPRRTKRKKKSSIIFDCSLLSTDLGEAREFLTSKSDSSRCFASD